MTAPAVMTYTSLLSDMENYTDRHDTVFLDQRERLVMLAENRICSEVKGLGYLRSATASFTVGVDGSVIQKPQRWRETVSWNFGNGTGNNTRNWLYQRTYEYCRAYWPDPTSTGVPRFYSEYDWSHWLVVATPDDTYPFEVMYRERPIPLSAVNTTNWTTQYAPQLLLYACLLEAAPFVKNFELVQTWQALYDRAASALSVEDLTRQSDRSSADKGGKT